MSPKKKLSYSTRIILIVSAFLLVMDALLGGLLMWRSTEKMKDIIQNKIMEVSLTAASFLDGDQIKSLTKEDKIKKANFHAIKAPHVDAPMFTELPLVIEGEVISYDDNTCRLVVKIINVLADESILDSNGKVDPTLLEPIAYDPFNHKYLVVKEIVGSAFKDGVELLKK